MWGDRGRGKYLRHGASDAAVCNLGEDRKPAEHVLAAAEHSATGTGTAAFEVLRVHEQAATVVFGRGRPLLNVDAAAPSVRLII